MPPKKKHKTPPYCILHSISTRSLNQKLPADDLESCRPIESNSASKVYQNGRKFSGVKINLMQSEIKTEYKDQLKLLITELKKDPNSQEFHKPVEWESMGLWNYLQIVKKPMDLQTVKNNVQNDKYRTFGEFFNTIQQIWTNCKLYNQ
jgi:polyribonucleotide nucleotidyltransferase